MTKPNLAFLEGKNIYLKPIDEEDFHCILSGLRSIEIRNTLGLSKIPLPPQKEIKSYLKALDHPNTIIFSIFNQADNNFIGQISLSQIDWIHRSANIGIAISQKMNQSKGLGSEAVFLVMDYGLNELGLNRLWSQILENNIFAIKCFMKMGGKQEGIARQAVFFDGGFKNLIYVALLKSDFELQRTQLNEQFRKKQ